jgi:tight adherence protein C
MMFVGLPDGLDMLVVCVEAGMGLDAAINRVGEEMKASNKVLSDELKLVTLELRAGKHRQEALRNLAQRTDLEDLSSLVSLLVQTDKFGTSIAQALRVYSDSMRTKRYQRAEEIAAKIAVKLTFPLILFIFPSLFVVILGPAMIRIYRTFMGH